MEFEVLDIDALARIGIIKTNNKEILTPNLLPVVHPSKNIIPAQYLNQFGAQGIFINAYIIHQNDLLRNKVLEKGLHKYFDYNGIIATDSGAFQQYMYNDKITVEAPIIESFQENIGSDFPVILDIPVQLNDKYAIAKKKVALSINRAKDNIIRRKRVNCTWFGPIHGGIYNDLVKKCTIEMNKLDFGVYAIGGLVKAFLEYRFELTLQILLTVKKNIIPNKPIHMFGLGLPQFFSLAIACGCDLMDSAAYILFAQKNRYFTLSTGTKNLEELEEFPCHCPICSKYSPNEIRKFEQNLRIEMLARHNLYISFSELRTIRQSIREGNLWELVEQRIRNHPNLVMAARIIKENRSFFEIYEKIYKNHGRLYSSSESLNRPLIYRYISNIKNRYRVPRNIKYLLILPELDIKAFNSPSIKQWLEKINNNQIVHRKYIHIVFFSKIYGIIPIELIETFPMGQHETIYGFSNRDVYFNESLKKSTIYFEKHLKCYEKCGILIPENYIDQFNKIKKISENNPINSLESLLKTDFGQKTLISNSIETLLSFFKNG